MLRVNRLVFILVLAALLAACAGPAAAPSATLGPATPTAVPPTSTPVPPDSRAGSGRCSAGTRNCGRAAAAAPSTAPGCAALWLAWAPYRGRAGLRDRGPGGERPDPRDCLVPGAEPGWPSPSKPARTRWTSWPTQLPRLRRPGDVRCATQQPDACGGAISAWCVYSDRTWLTLFLTDCLGFWPEHLASQGFRGDRRLYHEDNWGDIMCESTYKSDMQRVPKTWSRQLDFAEALTAPKGELAGLIDMESGGRDRPLFWGQMTALLAGGARLNTNMFLITSGCATNPVDGAD